MIIVPNKTNNKIQFKDTLGYMPESLARKPYMQVYHRHHEYDVVYDPEMKGWFKNVTKAVSKAFKDTGKFLSKAAKDVGQIAKPVMKAIKDVGEITEDAYDAAKKVALKALPPGMREYVSDALIDLEKSITNPTATIARISESAVEIAGNIVREVSKPVDYVYKDVIRPGFRIVRNVANEAVWKPIHKVVDVAILPVLPKSVREKVDNILDIPEKAFSGKLTDKTVVEGLKAVYQIGLIPTKMAGKFANDTINTLKKDNILGPFLENIDKYSGGLLTSAQNLTTLPDQIYHNKNIDWKQTIIDGLKIYLATISVNQLITSVTTTYAGEETGLNKTALGRATLMAASMYGTSVYKGSDWASIATAGDAAKKAALNTAKAESVTHAVKNGWVDSKQTASLILSASGKLYDTAGTDTTLMKAMENIHDHEFQKYVNNQIKDKLGVELTYAHLVDVYETKWEEIAENIVEDIKKMAPVIGTIDGEFLVKMGKNFVDEMKSLPENFSNISSNVLNEIEYSPEKLMKLAKDIANEANRTPENIARIANNIASETVKAPEVIADVTSNIVNESGVFISNVVDEVARTPDNISDIASNIATESGVFISNVVDEVARTPDNISNIASNIATETGVAVTNIGKEITKLDYSKLLEKYGTTLVQFLSMKYPNFNPHTDQMPDYIYDDIQYNFSEFQTNSGKKSKTPLFMAGIVSLAAIAYLVQDE